MLTKLRSKRGAALLTVLMIGTLLTAFYLVYSLWAKIGSRSVGQSLGMQKATYNAESGYYAALDWLKTPASAALTSSQTLMQSLTVGATYQLALQRAVDPRMIVIISTGYYAAIEGPTIDPMGQKAYSAVVEAKVRVDVIRDYFAVVPGPLSIAYGSNLEFGKVYGKELIFNPGAGPPTKVEGAYYFTSVTPADPTTFVEIGPGGLHQLSTELGAPRVSIMADYYNNLADSATNPCILPVVSGECVLSGAWSPPANPNNICYCGGDLVLGQPGNPLTMLGKTVVYSEGFTNIRNSVYIPNLNDNWLAVVSVQDVSVEAAAPDILTITGTFVTDQGMKMLGGNRASGQLTFTGGVVAQQGISLAGFRQSRTYNYQPAHPDLQLPFLVQPIAWAIRKRHSH